MWFKKKKEEVEKISEKIEKKPEKTSTDLDVERLEAFRGIGEKFNYLGIEMTVTRHSHLEFMDLSVLLIPCLEVDYVTKIGELKQVKFHIDDLEKLRKENKIKKN